MLDIAGELHDWCTRGKEFAVATVVAVSGSAPRQPGAALAVDREGTAVGSISGGCVEGAVYELCRETLADGRARVERFGYSDDDALAVGLTCGGEIEVLITRVPGSGRAEAAGAGDGYGAGDGEVYSRALAAAAAGRPAALVRVVDGPAALPAGRALLVDAGGRAAGGGLGAADLERSAAGLATAVLRTGRTTAVGLGAEGGYCGEPVRLLVEASVPPPRMLVFGAVDFAAALAGAGRFLGYRVTVCDARPVFATAARFPDAEEVVAQWPHRYLDDQWRSGKLDERTVICVLTHDAKFDVPLLERALRLPGAYIGAMGSRRTHDDRLRRLREAGLTDAELSRLHSPIGLDLGARTPEETALSITAEITAVRHGGTGLPLSSTGGTIHRTRPLGDLLPLLADPQT